VNRAFHNIVIFLMVMIIEMKAVLPRDTLGKACRRFLHQNKTVVVVGSNFFNRMIYYLPMIVVCDFGINSLTVNCFLAILRKK
jgi:hypothetical protein